MLKKLLKHEWIATGRRYGLFYLILAAVTVFTALVWLIDIDSAVIGGMQGLLMALYVITLIAVWFCSVGLAVVRFYKNMVSDEGYLTFTLPAKVEELVAAKFIVAFVWQLVTILCTVASLGIVFMPQIIESWDEISGGLSELMDTMGWMVGLYAVMIFVSMVYQLFVYYLSIAIGQTFAGNKIGGSIVGYLIISFVIEIAMVAIMMVGGFIAGFENMDVYMNTQTGMQVFMYGICALMLVIAAVEYYVTCRILKKKLNLT